MLRFSVMILALLSLTACVPLLLGGGVYAGATAVEERPVSTVASDARIYANITKFFLKSPVQDLGVNVNVRVFEGRVLLAGQSRNPKTKTEAERLAWQAKGVREVINEVHIEDPGGVYDTSKDELTETQIETRLLAERGVNSANFNAEVVNRVAYVIGIAQDETELNKVLYVVSRIQGVQKVVSYIRLKSQPLKPGTAPTGSTNGTNPYNYPN